MAALPPVGSYVASRAYRVLFGPARVHSTPPEGGDRPACDRGRDPHWQPTRQALSVQRASARSGADCDDAATACGRTVLRRSTHVLTDLPGRSCTASGSIAAQCARTAWTTASVTCSSWVVPFNKASLMTQCTTRRNAVERGTSVQATHIAKSITHPNRPPNIPTDNQISQPTAASARSAGQPLRTAHQYSSNENDAFSFQSENWSIHSPENWSKFRLKCT